MSVRPRAVRGQEAGEHQMVKRWSSIPRVNVELADEVVDAFRQALKSREHRERQLADFRCCRGLGLCGICNEYERLVAIVDTALGVRPSKLSPVDVIYGPAPPTWTADEQADWDRARDQHLELAEAAKIEPRRKALLTDACRGHCNVRWVERHCRVPDGPSVGQAVSPPRVSAWHRPKHLRRLELLAGRRRGDEEWAPLSSGPGA